MGRGSRPRGARRGLTTSLEGSDRRRTSSSTRRRQREQAQSPAGRTTRVAPHLPPTRTSAHPHIMPATSHSAPALLARFQALWRREQSNFAHAKARPRPGRCPARTRPDPAPRIAHGSSALARTCGVTLAALPTASVALTRQFVGNACRHFSCEAPRHGAPPHDRSFDNEPPRAGQRRLNQHTHSLHTHTHTSYHRTPFTTIHLLHHNLPAQPTAPPPDPSHDRLSPRPPPVSSPPPMHGFSKTVYSVRCLVIGFLLAAHLPSSRAPPPRPRGARAPRPRAR